MKLRYFTAILMSMMTITNSIYAESMVAAKQFSDLEKKAGGKLGVAALNTANNQLIQYRANERFPMGCTSKVMGVAAILKSSESNPSLLQEKITYTSQDLVFWSPITKQHLTNGMTVSELSAAAISYSDNAAMNLLAEKLGGTKAINRFARSIGDNTFRLDHTWPKEAESGGVGNIADSSTPTAMQKSLYNIALGHALAKPQREALLTWMQNNKTGENRIRAGVPKGWLVGDKTGTGDFGTTNDIAVIWPPHCAPLVVVINFTTNNKTDTKNEAVVAEATRILLQEFSKSAACLQA